MLFKKLAAVCLATVMTVGSLAVLSPSNAIAGQYESVTKEIMVDGQRMSVTEAVNIPEATSSDSETPYAPGFDPLDPDCVTPDTIILGGEGARRADLSAFEAIKVQTYAPEEIVTVIVELNREPLGEVATAEYKLNSVQTMSASALAFQNSFYSEQASVIDDVISIDSDAEILFRYDTVFNGFAAEVRYMDIEAIKSNSLVKEVYISSTYEAPYTPNDTSSNDMIGVPYSWDQSYDGDGMLISVIDSGIDYTHPLLNNLSSPGMITQQEMIDRIKSVTLTTPRLTNPADGVKNNKVIFGYDYRDGDTDPQDQLVGHGTHVAGIIAANTNPEGVVIGVAPKAQLMAMKVFSSSTGTSTDAALLAGIDDSVKLGADSINMSLGAASGFAVYDDAANARFKLAEYFVKAKNIGCTVNCAAGNDGNVGYGSKAYLTSKGFNNYQLPFAKNVDYGLLGSPGVDHSAISVASIVNANPYTSYVLVDGTDKVTFSDTNTPSISQRFNDREYDFVCVPGLGYPSDYTGINVGGKIAVIKRGDLNFIDKGINAFNAGAVGFIIYNTEGGYINMQLAGCPIPGISISHADGEALVAKGTGKIKFSTSYMSFIESEDGYKMVQSSSRGVSDDLKLKPEITAPGDSIYSTFPTVISGSSGYKMMSGTSMATPHIAAATALIKQHVEKTYPGLTPAKVNELVEALMMSTAKPLKDGYGVTYPTTAQGAGLVDLKGAISAKAVLYNVLDKKAKVELGDELDINSISVQFVAENLTGSAQTYDLSGELLVDKTTPFNIEGDDSTLYYNTLLSQNYGSYDSITVSGQGSITDGKLTLSPNGKATLTAVFSLSNEEHEALMVAFEYGYIVNGFVYLTPDTSENYSLSIPFMGFVGDWGAAPALDKLIANEDVYSLDEVPFYFVDGLLDGTSVPSSYLGYNAASGRFAPKDHMAISPNSDGNGDYCQWVIAPLRNIRKASVEITNSAGEIVANLNDSRSTFFTKSYVSSSTGALATSLLNRNVWRGNYDIPGDYTTQVPEGWYTNTLKVTLTDGTVQTKSAEVFVDRTKPTVNWEITQENGRYYLDFGTRDNHYLKDIMVRVDFNILRRILLSGYSTYSTYEDTTNGSVDITEFVEFYGSVKELEKHVVIDVYDYAKNRTSITLSLQPAVPTIFMVTNSTQHTASLPDIMEIDLEGTALEGADIAFKIRRRATGDFVEVPDQKLKRGKNYVYIDEMPQPGTYDLVLTVNGKEGIGGLMEVKPYVDISVPEMIPDEETNQVVVNFGTPQFFETLPVEAYWNGLKLDCIPHSGYFVIGTPYVPGKVLEFKYFRGLYSMSSWYFNYKGEVLK